jgi:5-hydroxyisourate hydrolase
MSVDPITCHILDTNRGKPASQVVCQLYFVSTLDGKSTADNANPFAMNHTDGDGRIKNWIFDPNLDSQSRAALGIDDKKWSQLKPGIYKVKFLTGKYFFQQKNTTFFPFVEITFIINNPPDNHYHIPLLLSNHSYTTYRGS